jgi:hypothetical protein
VQFDCCPLKNFLVNECRRVPGQGITVIFVLDAAKADDPVFRDAGDGIEKAWRYREHVTANAKRLSAI